MSKVIRKKRKPKLNTRHYWLCELCANEREGFLPKDSMGLTCIHDKCPYCNIEQTLIPWVDFNWPSFKAVWD